ncbi:MAG: hypothetical protein RJA75_490 [Actinomycetota bacterium]|jgi:hypothetical protein
MSFDSEPLESIVLSSDLTCQACGLVAEQIMPTDFCVWSWDCPGCGHSHKPLPGDCCVFCSFGNVPCPPKQVEDGSDSCC